MIVDFELEAEIAYTIGKDITHRFEEIEHLKTNS